MKTEDLNNLYNNKGEDVTRYSRARKFSCDVKYLSLKKGADFKDVSEKSYIAIYPVCEDGDIKGMIDNDGFVPGTRRKRVLKKGTVIIRYGPQTGKFFAPPNTPYEQLSLPFDESTNEFHVYRVIRDMEVEEGIIAPYFDRIGGGIQYYSKKSAKVLIDPNSSVGEYKILEEITSEEKYSWK